MLSHSAGRALTVLAVGMLMGGAAAMLAGSVLTAQAAEEALAIDRAAALSDAAATVHASLNQAGLVIAAAPDREDRAVLLALDVVTSSRAALDRQVESLEPGDAALANAATGYAAAALDLARQLTGGGIETPDPDPANLAYRALADVVDHRLRAGRAAVAAMTGARGMTTAATATILLVLLPGLAVALIARSTRRPAPNEPPDRATAGMPLRLVAELEDRATAITDHARRMTWIRPDDREAGPYRSLLAETSGMSVTARNLLALERMNQQEMIVTSEPTDLASIAERIRSTTMDLAWEIDVVRENVVVLADPVRVEQVVENLLSVLVGCGAGRIALVLGRNGKTGSISVAGDDCSLPRESLRVIHGAPGAPQRGAGIALTVSRTLVEAMSGSLRHDELEGTTIFTVALPLARVS